MTYLSISERWCSISISSSDHCILIIFQLIISAFFLFHLFVAQQWVSALFIARCNNSWRRASLASLLIGSKFSRGSSHTQRRRWLHKSVNRSAEAHAVDAIVDCESPVLPFVVVQFVCPCGHPIIFTVVIESPCHCVHRLAPSLHRHIFFHFHISSPVYIPW